MVTSSRIKVYVRLRPSSNISSSPSASSSGIDVPANLLSLDTVSNCITIQGGVDPHLLGSSRPSHGHNSSLSPTTFQFDRVLPPPTTNASLYSLSALPLIRSSLAGYNATLLTYGQTGAGKTYTTFGPPAGSSDSYKERGLCARAIAGVFDEISKYKNMGDGGAAGTPIEVRMSCIEIYNESLFDLLGFSGGAEEPANLNNGANQPGSTASSSANVPNLALFESASSGVLVRGLTLPLVNNSEEGLNLLFESQMNRAIAEHQLNDASSRSHCIFTFHFIVRNPVSNKVTTSKFNIVDLAGSERMVKTEAVGQVQRESNYINKSLSFLEQVVVALASKVSQKKGKGGKKKCNAAAAPCYKT